MRSTIIAVGALLALAITACALAQPAGYQGPTFDDPARAAVELVPAWRAPLDAPSAVLSGSTLLYRSGGALVAADVADGAQRWRHGPTPMGPSAVVGDLVLVGGEDLTALHIDSGEIAWRYEQPGLDARTITPLADVIVVAGDYGQGGAVLNLDGSLQFGVELPGFGGPVLAADDVLYWQASYGEPHFENVIAFDLDSGAELWRAGRTAGPLAVRDGVAYLLDADWSRRAGRPPHTQEMLLVDGRDGSELERWRYESPDASGFVPFGAHRLLLDDDRMLVVRADGGAVAEFPLGGASGPTSTHAPTYHRGTYRLAPVAGLLLFETDVHALRGVTLDGGDIDYADPGSPISRLDVHGTTLYVGRTDGLLTAVDLNRAHPRYFVRAGGFGFGPTLEADGHVVLQTTEEVVVVAPTTTPAPSAHAGSPVTLVTQHGTSAADADMVAVRDGSGPWRTLEGHAGNYAFEVESGSYSVAILCFEDAGPAITVYSFPTSDLPYLRHACEGVSDLLTRTHELHGALRWLEQPDEPLALPSHLLTVAYGGRPTSTRQLLPAQSSAYSFLVAPEAGDLIAVRAPAGRPPDRAALLRNLRIDESTRVDLDLVGPGSFGLEPYRVNLPPDASDALVRARLRTCNGMVVDIGQAGRAAADDPAAGATLAYAGLPDAERRACDRYELSILGTDVAGGMRFEALSIREPQDAQLALPEPPPEPVVTLAPGSSALRGVEWAPQDADDLYLFAVTSEGVRWQLFRSASLPTSLELPDLAAMAGWPAPVSPGSGATDAAFGVLRSNAGAWDTLLAWEQTLGYGRFPRRLPAELRFGAAIGAGVGTDPPTDD